MESLINMLSSEGFILKSCYLSGLIKTPYVCIWIDLFCIRITELGSQKIFLSTTLVLCSLVFPFTALWDLCQRSPFLTFSTTFSYCSSFLIISLTLYSCLLIPSFNNVYFSVQSSCLQDWPQLCDTPASASKIWDLQEYTTVHSHS